MFDRRSFGKIMGAGAAGASLAGVPTISAAAPAAASDGTQSAAPSAATPGRTSFGPLKQIRAGELNVG